MTRHPYDYTGRSAIAGHGDWKTCGCLACSDAREATNTDELVPDYRSLFGVRFDPLTTAPEPVTDQDTVPMLASIGVGLLLGVLVFLALLEAV